MKYIKSAPGKKHGDKQPQVVVTVAAPVAIEEASK